MNNRMTIAEQNAARKQDVQWGIWNTVIAVGLGIVVFALIAKNLGG